MDQEFDRPFAFRRSQDDPPLLRCLVYSFLGFALGSIGGLGFGLFQLALPWVMLPQPGAVLLMIVGFFALAGTVAGGLVGVFFNACLWAASVLRRRRPCGKKNWFS